MSCSSRACRAEACCVMTRGVVWRGQRSQHGAQQNPEAFLYTIYIVTLLQCYARCCHIKQLREQLVSWSYGRTISETDCRLIWAQVHTTDKRHIREGVKAADQLMTLGVDEHRQLSYLAAVGEYKCVVFASLRIPAGL